MRRIAIQSMLAMASLSSMASACPMCRDSTATTAGSSGGPPVALFNASVLWILAGFLVVVGFLIVKVVGAIRLANRRHLI
jgi:hypothetical protein